MSDSVVESPSIAPAIPATIRMRAEPLQENQSTRGWLVQIYPLDLERTRIQVAPPRAVLGRTSDCEIHFDDPSISRRHAELCFAESGLEIVDLGSTNGVYVNDQLVLRRQLRSGDRIRLGQRVFRFLAEGDEEAEYHETIYAMMTRDGLTSVFNKRYLVECLDREIARAERHSRPLALILLDLDHFKSINDTYGHLAGDDVLRELASRLTRTLRSDEVLARFGGEEFAIVATECDLAAARELAERCRRATADLPFATSAGPLDVTISLGIAAPKVDQMPDRQQLISQADARLYTAKRNGRNQMAW